MFGAFIAVRQRGERCKQIQPHTHNAARCSWASAHKCENNAQFGLFPVVLRLETATTATTLLAGAVGGEGRHILCETKEARKKKGKKREKRKKREEERGGDATSSMRISTNSN